MDKNERVVQIDIAIIGGGIAGLWALNRLKNLGYQAILLESDALGSGQTIKSQGIIHGGLKYALQGILSGSANAVETMPIRWKNCLQGDGELDLQKVKCLSASQLLWSTGSLGSEIASFFASKALNSRVQKLSRENFPSVLQNAAFKGHVYRLEEMVLDTTSLIENLSTLQSDYIFKINNTQGSEWIYENNSKNIKSLKIHSGTQTLNICAKRYLLTAGEGNEALISNISNAPAMQRRPLQMVYVKLDTHYPFFAHCIDGGINPRITITSHLAKDGRTVWYLGGKLAEEGVHRNQKEQFEAAVNELKALFPWLDLSGAEWGSFWVNRAEPLQIGGKRPETDFVKSLQNVIVAWPTKLALAPLLSDNIIQLLKEQNITPSKETVNLNSIDAEIGNPLEKPAIALPPWDSIS